MRISTCLQTYFPIPAHNHITVSDISEGMEQLTLVDMQGKTLLSQRIANPSICQLVNLSELGSGRYVLILQGEAVTSSRLLQKM